MIRVLRPASLAALTLSSACIMGPAPRETGRVPDRTRSLAEAQREVAAPDREKMRPPAPMAAPSVAVAAPAQTAAQISEEYKALQRIQAVLGWYAGTQGEASLNAQTYLGHEHLFAPESLATLDRELLRTDLDADHRLALKFLRRALAGESVGLAVAKFDDEFSDAEAAATVTLPSEKAPIPYRNLTLLIAAESDPAKRAVLYAASTSVIREKLNPILARKELAAQSAARAAGFTDYVALSEELRQVDLKALLGEGVSYLTATDEIFKKTLDRVAREELNIPRENLRVADLGRLWKAPKLAGMFEKDLELKALEFFLGNIGLDLKTVAGTEVQVDDSVNPKKRPRAFVQPVDPPGDVRLSVKPTGGLDDVWTLFHEAGHAVHFSSVTVTPWENATLGYGAPTEGFGEFFRHAFSDKTFLLRYREFLKKSGKPAPSNAQLAAVLRRTALIEMAYLRRYAFAKIAYELRLHGRAPSEIAPAMALLSHPEATQGDSESSLKSLYQQLFSRALTFALTDEEAMRFRADVDDTFYSADYSRAFVLAGMMHEGVQRKFGADWYTNHEVGKFLRAQIFAPGTTLSVDDVAGRLGFAPRMDFQLAATRAAKLCADADALEAAK
jgi:hypothetical protein